jgi:hypothetical protein
MNQSLIRIPVDRIEKSIYLIRGQKVMLDSDLAALYEVTTKVLNQAVRRNRERFPQDFMFQLNRLEADELNRSQFVTGSQKHRNPRFRPYAFTEQGVTTTPRGLPAWGPRAMLSSVLRSDRAALVNIAIMRAFVSLRQMLASNAELAHKLETLEKKYDRQFRVVFDAIRELMLPREPQRKPIGFAKTTKK